MRDFSNGPAPGFWRLWWNTGALVTAILAIAFLVCTAMSYASLRAGMAFDAVGVAVTAEVADRRKQEVRRDGKTETNYYVTMRYPVAGSEIMIEKRVGRAVFVQSIPGTNRSVRHMPDAPRQVEFTIGETWNEGQVLRWLSLALGAVALIAFWWTASPAVDGLLARRRGPAETARVLSVERRKFKSNSTYAIRFFGTDKTEQLSLRSHNKSRYDAVQPGAEIEVFRSPKGRLWWVGDVGPRSAAKTVPDAGKTSS